MMKKVFALLLIGLMVSSVVAASVKDKEVELEKIKQYIQVLDQKIEAARAANQVNKIAELKELKRVQMEKAKQLKQEVSRVGTARGWQVAAGFGGGGAIVDFGYLLPMEKFTLLLDLGYGLGNSYTVMKAGAAGIFNFGQNYLGVEVGAANYSKTISNVPGISGNVTSGIRGGAGLFIGKALNEKLSAQVGYNSALGVTAAVGYKL